MGKVEKGGPDYILINIIKLGVFREVFLFMVDTYSVIVVW